MTIVPKGPPGSPCPSEEDRPDSSGDIPLKSDKSENCDELSLVGYFFCKQKKVRVILIGEFFSL